MLRFFYRIRLWFDLRSLKRKGLIEQAKDGSWGSTQLGQDVAKLLPASRYDVR